MNVESEVFLYGEDQLTAGIALNLSRGKTQGEISGMSRQKIIASRKVVEKIVDMGEPVYGINTGFGPLCTTKISKEETQFLQTNILKSHSVGVGKPIDKEIAKLMLDRKSVV